jgi:hypothetical protein
VPQNQFTKNEAAAAAELALKAHVLAFDPEILAEMTDGDKTMPAVNRGRLGGAPTKQPFHLPMAHSSSMESPKARRKR